MIMLMNIHTGTVLTEEQWEEIYNNSTPEEWGGENFNDANLVRVYWYPAEEMWMSEEEASEQGFTVDYNSASVVWFACTCEERCGELDNGSFQQGAAEAECIRMIREGFSHVDLAQCDKDGDVISGAYTSMKFWLETKDNNKFYSLDEVREYLGKFDVVEDEDYFIESDYYQK